MKNIDYDAYLKGLGDFETNQKNIIKKYLEEQCEKDPALKSFYKPEKLGVCYDFIKECARKKSTGNGACIEDVIVFKRARDFFLEILPKAEEEEPEVKAADVEAVKETVEEVADEIQEEVEQTAATPKTDEHGFEIFGVDEEENPDEDKPVEEPIEAEQSDEVQYDEEGQGLLFSF